MAEWLMEVYLPFVVFIVVSLLLAVLVISGFNIVFDNEDKIQQQTINILEIFECSKYDVRDGKCLEMVRKEGK